MRAARRLVVIALAGCALIDAGAARSARGAEPRPERVGKGLRALYDFRSSSGAIVKDRSGAGKPLNLRITNTKSVRRSEGALEVRGKTLIRSDKAASKIIDAVRKSGAITIEAWVRPAKTGQSGPARILTLSKNTSERNFTLGQDGDRYDVRFRTNKTSSNGIPSLSAARKSLTTKLTHVVYTRQKAGRTHIYINGRKSAEKKISGAPSNWNGSHRLALANELTNDRPWLGVFHLVALYDRELSPKEVEQNFKAGAGAQGTTVLFAEDEPEPDPRVSLAVRMRHFDTQIAPLLARRCLECHGWKSKKGGLDLTRKVTALKGGKNGKVIAPGLANKSSMWEAVKDNEMPKKRTPLSNREKRLLREWIDAGAVWSAGKIEQADYVRDRHAIWLRRLTVPEYIATVRAVVGVDVTQEARKLLPRDLRADGFSNTAYNLTVDLGHVQAYARLADIIVGKMDVATFASRYAPRPDLKDSVLRQTIAGMGKRLLRGPLQDRETAAYVRITHAVTKEGGDFTEAVRSVVEAMLQSPRFIYRIENQRGDGAPRPAGRYELASRLSYMIWGGPPDAQLLRAAETGALAGRAGVEAQARRMLADPRAVQRSLQFIHEWLNLGRLNSLRPNRRRFPKWNGRLATDMREETLAFFKDVAWTQKRPLWDLLNAQVTYLTPALAAHYGLTPRGKGLARYDLSPTPARGGLLTQGSVLTIGGDEASMVTRGLFVLKDLLNGKVDDPPPCVDITPVPTKKGRTQRGVALERIGNKSCGGCHGKFEPLAFGLEKFDGLGTFHDVDEHGNALRDDGGILFPGTKKPVPFKSASELMNLLAGSNRVRMSLTRKVAQFALGRPLDEADESELKKVHAAALKSGGTYAALIAAIATSDLVRMTRTEKTP